MKNGKFGDDRYCFVCGELNQSGLRLNPEGKDGKGTIHWTPTREYQGYTGVLHGGITSALMDEAMAYAALSVVATAVTAEITINFRKPVLTDESIIAEGKVVEQRGKIILTSGRILQKDNIMATATAKFVVV